MPSYLSLLPALKMLITIKTVKPKVIFVAVGLPQVKDINRDKSAKESRNNSINRLNSYQGKEQPLRPTNGCDYLVR
jgi:hypothetical protein